MKMFNRQVYIQIWRSEERPELDGRMDKITKENYVRRGKNKARTKRQFLCKVRAKEEELLEKQEGNQERGVTQETKQEELFKKENKNGVRLC